MATVTVLGAGMMGTALCTPLADAGHEVRLVGTHLDGALIAAMKADGVHPKLKLPLPARVTPFALEELAAAMAGVDFVGVGVSSAGVRWAARTLAPHLAPGTPVLAVTKGLEEAPPGELRVLPDVFHAELPASLRATIAPAAIGGPCIAGEIARRVPTGVVFTGRDRAVLERLAAACAAPYYHVRVSTDVVGVEACAALKNAYAMAAGIGAGVHERAGGQPGPVAHHNYEAAVFAQACLEMDRLVRALGGDPAQVPHLAGAGDLLVTTSGGRSSRLGRLLGLGLSFAEARARMAGDTLESADTVAVVGGALPRLCARGALAAGALPLMEHLHEVIVLGRPVAMPFARFFRD
ncbi:MAG TPA: 2-dehydropantoate 2-reductase N-terminal domain-containing protein [Polyangia bacterium]|jgi:glycerol-3-phosphate dehydrogenase (NAD(P)+)